MSSDAGPMGRDDAAATLPTLGAVAKPPAAAPATAPFPPPATYSPPPPPPPPVAAPVVHPAEPPPAAGSLTERADHEPPHRNLVRALLSWSYGGRPSAPPEVGPLITIHKAAHPRADVRMLTRAYRVAERLHSGQMRRSGDPYITHPLAVATILGELGMDTTTLAAALLHDTVEDTRYTLTQLRIDFGDDVALLVDGVTKLDKVRFGGAAEAETMRKMILAAGQDVRVLIIKLADRLHNMRTLGFKSRPSQVRIAVATREVLVPLAGRLGVHVLKRQLEDLVLNTLHPEAFTTIHERVQERAPSRTRYLAATIQPLLDDLREARVRAEVTERPRHYQSIFEGMASAGLSDRLCDNPRVQIVITGDSTDCYAALGIVHGRWHPVPGRFKDFIGVPKFNMYQSLHTTVVADDGQLLDVMIRTVAMDRIAEFGVVAYRQSAGEKAPEGVRYAGTVGELEWLQRLLDWEPDASEPQEFLASLRYDLSDHEVLVFSPKGEAITLPSDATPVDLAYALSTRLGDRCFGAKVNGQLTPLSSVLNDGDLVEILTSSAEYAGPSEEWLEFVRTPKALLQIKRWFAEQANESAVIAGRRAIGDALVTQERMLMTEQPLVVLARSLELPDVEALYAAIGTEQLDAAEMVRRLIVIVDGHEGPDESIYGVI
ncbi:MAG: diphosphokinase / guanosine-3,5-bis(diphosphate) 3-diphosphatase [Cryptosporangiaceae bacterium]|nr:diphosphokinase / guanosine-3,5-bis(diphosphate) 3-diphosphatase [Cryptosporangiaceae bacterium]